ncbi:uncharacterized protein FOMMEDRAFT_162569 [Fomitiporia mediterranea MF3/22]|uniref:Uncharacterized protein n=1 Tax=Fomitiporia mediterranea (strain MF3/22) TaxID=694068 RepID=R7SGE4_FOMME|nr:uncharacterized protein FOMMEDRAFT_162569 [Fomitiporia mediterranea MF3/22]EJC97758.1 hypothetical protein FOMMEDRAFT_162569 [Fomitiporia mediterranea MF3/22]
MLAAPDNGGLASSWWRGWAKTYVDTNELFINCCGRITSKKRHDSICANDESVFIGAAIVDGFVLVPAGGFGGRDVLRKMKLGTECGMTTTGYCCALQSLMYK